MYRRLLPVLVSVFLCGAAAAGPRTSVDYGVTMTTGYDSNPLRVTREVESDSSLFGQLRFDGGVSHSLNPALSLFANGEVRGRFHGESTSGADFGSGQAAAGLQIAPRSVPRLLMATGVRYRVFRATYTDPASGAVFEVAADPDPDPPSTVEIGERLDHDTSEAFLNLRWRQNEKLLLFVDSRYEDAVYVEDYADTTVLQPLDFRALTVEPGLSVQVHRAARLALSVSRTQLDYDEQSALDVEGFRVEDETREYDYMRYRASLQVVPAKRFNLWLGGRAADRSDVFAGYYDYRATSAYVALDRQLGPRALVRVRASYSDLTYDRATVTGDPEDQVLDNEITTYLARYEHGFGRSATWFVEGGTQNTDSQDPVFANDTDWVLGGIQIRKR